MISPQSTQRTQRSKGAGLLGMLCGAKSKL